uniref:Asteroid domain-containing protein n=1 Tax=Neogobius melanostomus TaxID=47308 RepID=A0A8C6U9I1_9GOBI
DGYTRRLCQCSCLDLDVKFGGEYGAFKNRIEQFIEALRRCDIQPYVVLDGCADFPDLKWKTRKQRAEQRLKEAHDVATEGKKPWTVLPTLIWEVFRQTLTELHVPLARCYTEADQQVAALAQEWGCPVLSYDSDFFIFPLTRGMLHIKYFRWKNVQQREEQSFIPCKTYLSSRFCEAFSIQPLLLPVLPLCGFKNADPQEVFEEFLKDVPLEEREQRINSLQEAAHNYSLPLSSLSDFFKSTLPPLRPVTEARFSSDFLDVLTNQRVGLSVVVDDMDKPSANQVSLPLRRVLYELLLGRDKESALHVVQRPQVNGESEGAKHVFALDRKLAMTLCQAQDLAPNVESLIDVCVKVSLFFLQTALEQRRQVLLNALGVNVKSLGSLPIRLSDLALPLAATCFWLKEATPSPDPSLLKALLIGWCRGDTLRNNGDKSKSQITIHLGRDLDKDWCHWMNQWQSCLKDSFLLNQLLGAPLPDLTELQVAVDFHLKLDSGSLNQSYIHDEDFKALLSITQRPEESPGYCSYCGFRGFRPMAQIPLSKGGEPAIRPRKGPKQ